MSAGQTDEYTRAQRIAFLLLKFRARSEKEIIERLKRKRISAETIEKTVEFLRRQKFIDDDEFARAWLVNSCSKKVGLRKAAFELKQKGINKKTIDVLIDSARQDYNESSVALELAQQRLGRLSQVDTRTAKRRIYGFLIRRGFSIDVVNDVMQEL